MLPCQGPGQTFDKLRPLGLDPFKVQGRLDVQSLQENTGLAALGGRRAAGQNPDILAQGKFSVPVRPDVPVERKEVRIEDRFFLSGHELRLAVHAFLAFLNAGSGRLVRRHVRLIMEGIVDSHERRNLVGAGEGRVDGTGNLVFPQQEIGHLADDALVREGPVPVEVDGLESPFKGHHIRDPLVDQRLHRTPNIFLGLGVHVHVLDVEDDLGPGPDGPRPVQRKTDLADRSVLG